MTTPLEKARQATLKAARAAEGLSDSERLAFVVASAISAYEQEHTIQAVRLLQPKAGDIVVFHVDATDFEREELLGQLEPLKEHCPGVLFVAAERVEDITVVRPEPKPQCKRLDCDHKYCESAKKGNR